MNVPIHSSSTARGDMISSFSTALPVLLLAIEGSPGYHLLGLQAPAHGKRLYSSTTYVNGSNMPCSAVCRDAVRHEQTACVTCLDRPGAVMACSWLLPRYLACIVQARGGPCCSLQRCTSNANAAAWTRSSSRGRDRWRRRTKSTAVVPIRFQATTATSSTSTLASPIVKRPTALQELSDYRNVHCFAHTGHEAHVSASVLQKYGGSRRLTFAEAVDAKYTRSPTANDSAVMSSFSLAPYWSTWSTRRAPTMRQLPNTSRAAVAASRACPGGVGTPPRSAGSQ